MLIIKHHLHVDWNQVCLVWLLCWIFYFPKYFFLNENPFIYHNIRNARVFDQISYIIYLKCTTRPSESHHHREPQESTDGHQSSSHHLYSWHTDLKTKLIKSENVELSTPSPFCMRFNVLWNRTLHLSEKQNNSNMFSKAMIYNPIQDFGS